MAHKKFSNFMSSKVWSKIFLFLIIGNLILFVWTNKNTYLHKYDYTYWQNQYDHSQYAQGDKSPYILSDSDLNTLRGYLYVEKGIDMENFIPGHPPLASYLFGISIALFGNQYIASLVAGIFSLFLLYRICLLITQNKTISLFITFLFSVEPIFVTQLNDSMLDIFQLVFGLAAFLNFLLWIKKNSLKYLLLSQMFIGFTISSKFFISGAPLPIALAISVIFLNNFKKFSHYILSLPIIGLGYLIGHLTYFFYHSSLLSFIKYQRYIINWWFGSPQIDHFKVWDLILFNRWHTWWGNMAIVPVSEWRLTWPIIIIVSLVSIFVFIRRPNTLKLTLPLYLWLVVSLLLYSFEAVYPRHLLFIIPAAYILAPLAIIKLKCPKY